MYKIYINYLIHHYHVACTSIGLKKMVLPSLIAEKGDAINWKNVAHPIFSKSSRKESISHVTLSKIKKRYAHGPRPIFLMFPFYNGQLPAQSVRAFYHRLLQQPHQSRKPRFKLFQPSISRPNFRLRHTKSGGSYSKCYVFK